MPNHARTNKNRKIKKTLIWKKMNKKVNNNNYYLKDLLPSKKRRYKAEGINREK